MRRRFFLNYVNAKERAYSASIGEAHPVHIRGWNAGVEITPRTGPDGADTFVISMTYGSRGHSEHAPITLGVIRETPDGPDMVVAPGVVAVDQIVEA